MSEALCARAVAEHCIEEVQALLQFFCLLVGPQPAASLLPIGIASQTQ